VWVERLRKSAKVVTNWSAAPFSAARSSQSAVRRRVAVGAQCRRLEHPVLDAGLPLVAARVAPPHQLVAVGGELVGLDAGVPGRMPLFGELREQRLELVAGVDAPRDLVSSR